MGEGGTLKREVRRAEGTDFKSGSCTLFLDQQFIPSVVGRFLGDVWDDFG